MTDAPHSWLPRDLATSKEAGGAPTLAGLAYPGLRHLISGEPETGKTWLVLILATLEIKAGRPVFWFDFGEMGDAAVRERLAALGITDDERDGLFFYFEPEEAIGDEARADLTQLIDERQPSLAVIDAYTGALELHDLSPDKAKDVQAFQRRLVQVLRRHGAAVVTIDHVVKDPEKRGKFSTGSERKLGVAEVHLGLEVIRPFGRGKTGVAKVTTKKDRPGWLPRPKTAEFELTANEDGTRATWALRLSETGTDTATETFAFRPTALMEKVSRYLELQHEPVSRTAVVDTVQGKTDYVRLALDVLIAERYAEETAGARNARLVTSNAPFREHDPAPTPPPGADSHPAPDPAPAEPHEQTTFPTPPDPAPTPPPTPPDDPAPVQALPYRGSEQTGRGEPAPDADAPRKKGGSLDELFARRPGA